MYKKTFFKILSVIFISIFAIYFTLNKETIEDVANGLFNKPMNVTISSITDTSFNVFWQTRTNDKSLLVLTLDSNKLFSTSELVFDTSHQYLIDKKDYNSNSFYEIQTENSITELGHYTNHFVTINGLKANSTLYFAISNGRHIWKIEPGTTSFKNNLQNPFYYKVITKSFCPKSTLPQPIILSIDSKETDLNLSDAVITLKKDNTSIFSYMSSSRLTVMDGSNLIKNKDTIELTYFTAGNEPLYKTFTLDALDLDIDKRLISLKGDFKPILSTQLISNIKANENVCCALKIENEEEFFGSNYSSSQACAENNGIVIPNVNTPRACNITFTSVCCNGNDEYNWVPEISCPIDQVLNLQYEACFKEELDIQEYTINLDQNKSSFVLDFTPVYAKENGASMNLKEILSVINQEERSVQWIAAFDKKSSTWKYAVELENGHIVSNTFKPLINTKIYYYTTATVTTSLLGIK